MKTTHTNGEWKRNYYNDDGERSKLQVSSNGFLVAEIDAQTPERSKAENIANAKLIAAAPELLESLQSLVEWLDNNEHWLKIQGYGSSVLDIRKMENAYEVIKKATK